ncbi:MAG: acyltransferase family protein [Bacteroidota bacterium]
MKAEINKNFRYDINALRALAVIGVLLFHYKVPGFSGGFSGVDIFFVVSGFLMSQIILGALTSERFSFFEFYSRRLKRIVPALAVMIIVITLIGFFIYFPEDFKVNSKNALSSLLFLSNIWYYKHSNYFDMASDTNVFLHTWSLSVEWQFYMLYPVLLVILNKIFRSTRLLTMIFITTSLILCLFSIYITSIAPSASFYLLPTRSWEMIVGGVAYLVSGTQLSMTKRKYLAFLGYSMLIVGIILMSPSMPWPGVFTILPVLGTFIIIVANYNNLYILKSFPIQFFGRISYSLYLWHWPVYLVAIYMGFSMQSLSILIVALISIILGFLSFRHIESFKFSSNWLILIFDASLCAFLALLMLHNTNTWVFKPYAIKMANYGNEHMRDKERQFSIGCCFVYGDMKQYRKDICLKIDKYKKNVILIGDSHGAHLSTALKSSLQKLGVNLLEANTSGCFPLINPNGAKGCFEIIDYIYRDFLIVNKREIDGVIISAQWINLVNNNKSELLKDLNSTIDYLRNQQIPVVILGQNESYTIPFPSIIGKQHQYNYKKSIAKNYLNARAYEINTFLSENLKNYYINIINEINLPTINKEVPYMYDQDHLTNYGATLVTSKIFDNSHVRRFLVDVDKRNSAAQNN